MLLVGIPCCLLPCWGEICCDFGAAISSSSSVLLPLLIFSADLFPLSLYLWWHLWQAVDKQRCAWGFIFGSALLAEHNHQTAFHNHPLCQSWEKRSSLHSEELITAAGSSVASFQSFLVLSEPICFPLLASESWGCPRWIRGFLLGSPECCSVVLAAYLISPLSSAIFFYIKIIHI